jgi:hypothetical protein
MPNDGPNSIPERPTQLIAADDTPVARVFSTRTVVEGVLLGVLYGLFIRFGAQVKIFNSGAGFVMTSSFIFLAPMVMGFLTIRRAAVAGPVPMWLWFAGPSATVLFTLAGVVFFKLEGLICMIMALPVLMISAIIGGVIAGASSQSKRNISSSTTACIAILPLLLAPAETYLTSPTQTRTVASEIRIHASPATVWRNIERVPAISPTELQPSWTQRIGFPRPVEATLCYEGVGGVRHASFEHGLLFIETVTDWQPDQRLAFSIKADTAAIPPTTLDEHVTIGGRYFDVLDGEYRIEPLSNGDTLLHLTSHQRLSTNFNSYAGLWSDSIMQNLQTSILQVIQHRAEARKL